MILIRTVLAALLFWTVYGIREARAAFSPVACSVCPTMTEVDWSFNSLSEFPDDPNCSASTCPHYINNIHAWRDVYANRYVTQFQFRVDSFATEPGYDYLDFKEVGGAATRLSGTPVLGWYGVTSSSVVAHKPIDLLFHSDILTNRPGFRIGRARVCCQVTAGASVPTRALIPLGRTAGVLLGSEDVVYAYVPSVEQPTKQNIVLWAEPGRDFDLYARCGALPTQAVYDVRGYTADPQEFLSFVSGAWCPTPGTMYIAVHSYSGAGQFNLASSTMKHHHYMGARVGTNFATTAAQLDTIENTLLQASRQFYGQTEGQMLLGTYQLWNNTGATCGNCGGYECDICFMDQPGTGECCYGTQVRIYQSYFGNPQGVAHEFGHRYLGLPDEYDNTATGPRWGCGHSNMANPGGSNNNFCFVPGANQDHALDRTPGALPVSPNSAWVHTNNLLTTKLYETGDNYDYRDHDFNGEIRVVRQN